MPGLAYSSFNFLEEGYGGVIGSVLGGIRKHRFGEWTADAVIELFCGFTFDYPDPSSIGSRYNLQPFFRTLGIHLTTNECVRVAEGLARHKFSPESIANLVSNAIAPADESTEPVPVTLTTAPIGKVRFLLQQEKIQDTTKLNE